MKKSLAALKNSAWAGFVGLTDLTSALPSKLSAAFQSENLAQFFNALFQLAVVVGAMIAVLRLAYAGFLYMTSDAFGQKEHAKEIIRSSLAGLLILFGIWIILHQINPKILDLNILQHVQTIPSSGAPAAPVTP